MITYKKIPTKFFFDRAHAIARIGEARVKVLSKVGAFLRKRAQTIQRYRKKASAPGTPPSAHKERGALLRKLLYFSYDPRTDSVVVGPVAHGRGEAPNLNEFGGRVTRRRRGVPYVATYAPRPFMAPTLKAAEPKLPAAWSNSVKGP